MSQQSSSVRVWARWATMLVAAAGVVIAWYLTELHIQAQVGQTVGGPLCEPGGTLDCEMAIHSEYAFFADIPISLLGVAFYIGVLMLTLFDTEKIRQSSRPFRPAAISATLFGAGVIYSMYLAGVSAFELETFCPFCAMLYGANIIGLITTSLWAGAGPHRLLLKQIKSPKKVFNGYTGLFAIAFGVALIAGASVAETEIDQRDGDDTPVPTAEQGEPEQFDPNDYRVPDAPAKGAGADAPVHIVEFSNFACGFCAQLAVVMDRLVEEHGDLVRLEYRFFPGHDEAPHRAARAGVCAEQQGQFWEMADLLYRESPNFGPDQILDYGEQLNLDADEFEQCVDSDETRRRVDRDLGDGQGLGIRGTPTFFINGEQYSGMMPYEQLEEIVLQAAE